MSDGYCAEVEDGMVGWLAQLAERRSLAGELTLF